jgi:predicted DNA binding CopG/RHH family protein
MKKRLKTVPRFKTEGAERAFWSKHDATDFVDFSRGVPAMFPDLKPSARTISIRLPAPLLEALKVLANKRDVPYQSLMKLLLADAVEHELSKTRASRARSPRSAKKSAA